VAGSHALGSEGARGGTHARWQSHRRRPARVRAARCGPLGEGVLDSRDEGRLLVGGHAAPNEGSEHPQEILRGEETEAER